MQAVADFYAGFAVFMLFGSLIGLALIALQPALDRWKNPRRQRDDHRHQPERGGDDHRPGSGSLRRAA